MLTRVGSSAFVVGLKVVERSLLFCPSGWLSSVVVCGLGPYNPFLQGFGFLVCTTMVLAQQKQDYF